MHPTLSPEFVKHLARLVRLGMSDTEAEAFVPQLNAILEYFNLLQEVPTENVPPAPLLPGVRNVLRPDDPHPLLAREAFLREVPARAGEYVKVPLVLEE